MVRSSRRGRRCSRQRCGCGGARNCVLATAFGRPRPTKHHHTFGDLCHSKPSGGHGSVPETGTGGGLVRERKPPDRRRADDAGRVRALAVEDHVHADHVGDLWRDGARTRVIGIYGVIAYAITQRRREIGIRLALGERHAELRRRFLRHGLGLTCVGLAIGLGVSMIVTRLMTSLLFNVSPLDPLTYVAVALLLTTAAAMASYVPARRASTVPLIEVLAAQ